MWKAHLEQQSQPCKSRRCSLPTRSSQRDTLVLRTETETLAIAVMLENIKYKIPECLLQMMSGVGGWILVKISHCEQFGGEMP